MAGESKIEIVVTFIIAIVVWVFAIIYSPWARMMAVGAGLLVISFLLGRIIDKIHQPPMILLIILGLLGVFGYILIGIGFILVVFKGTTGLP